MNVSWKAYRRRRQERTGLSAGQLSATQRAHAAQAAFSDGRLFGQPSLWAHDAVLVLMLAAAVLASLPGWAAARLRAP